MNQLQAYTKRGQRVFLDFMPEISVNTLSHLERHTCNSEMNHNYDQVFYEKTSNENEMQFNCSVPFQPPSIKSKIRTGRVEICNNSQNGKKAYDYWRQMYSTESPKDEPCSSMDIFLGLPIIDSVGNDPNEAYMKLYFKSKIKVKTMVLYYDATTFAAEIGGYIGMLLGVSLIDITILCNTALLKIVTRRKNL